MVVRKFDDAKALQIGRALERQRGGLFSAPAACPEENKHEKADQ
jgi:hypothetical protein